MDTVNCWVCPTKRSDCTGLSTMLTKITAMSTEALAVGSATLVATAWKVPVNGGAV